MGADSGVVWAGTWEGWDTEWPDLEAYRVSPDQKLTWDTDKVNPLPAPPT
ncbi:hypothetical protein [Rhodococcus maanshanensis]|nr:hypothetical protein [Rhodococcus maanshanensis]